MSFAFSLKMVFKISNVSEKLLSVVNVFFGLAAPTQSLLCSLLLVSLGRAKVAHVDLWAQSEWDLLLSSWLSDPLGCDGGLYR